MNDLAWLDLAVKSANLGAWYWDLDDPKHLIVRNENYDRIYGLKPNQVWTRDLWVSHLHPKDRSDVIARMNGLIEGKKDYYQVDCRVIRLDGTIRSVNAAGNVSRDENGKMIVAGVVRDVTELKGLRHERDQLVATLSHDLRNALTAIMSNAELLRKSREPIQSSDLLLGRVIGAAERMDRMIRDLLDVFRAREGQRIHLVFQECDLRTLVEDVLRDLSHQFGDRFQFSSKGEFQGSWAGDGVRRVLENLISNAIKYGALDQPVRIALERSGEIVTLSVRNEGNRCWGAST
jgi:PAS domain S-box-containing protein